MAKLLAAMAHLQSTTGNPHQDRGLCCSAPSLLCSLSSADRERRELQENSKVSDLTEKRGVHGIGELELPVHPRPRFLFPFPHERLQWLHSPQDSQVASTEAGIWLQTCIWGGGVGVLKLPFQIFYPPIISQGIHICISFGIGYAVAPLPPSQPREVNSGLISFSKDSKLTSYGYLC